eukprot:scaffold13120_cov107-Isochrysis_galbana.AAC.2
MLHNAFNFVLAGPESTRLRDAISCLQDQGAGARKGVLNGSRQRACTPRIMSSACMSSSSRATRSWAELLAGGARGGGSAGGTGGS